MVISQQAAISTFYLHFPLVWGAAGGWVKIPHGICDLSQLPSYGGERSRTTRLWKMTACLLENAHIPGATG